jgi:hypothetical protein
MLESERVIVQAPMSFTGSARRIWRLTPNENPWWHSALVALAVLLVALAWVVVLAWYVLFGLLLVPYRLIRRGSRKSKRDEARHRELLSAQSANAHTPAPR